MSSAVTLVVALALLVLALANIVLTFITMSKVTDSAARQNARLDQIDTGIAGLTGDVQAMKDLIAAIQNSPGELSVEDQAALDSLEARMGVAADKLTALDGATPANG